MKNFFLTLVCFLALTTMAASGASLTKTVANINADASKEGGPAKVLEAMSKSTGVPVATLEKEKTATGLSYGDVFAAHTIAKASGKSFDEIAALKKKGDPWDKIASDNGLEIGGKKKAAARPQSTPKPSPTPPKKSLSEEMKDKFK